MKKTIYLALVILIGSFLLGPWAWADEKKEEAGAKVPKLMFKTDVGENIIDFKQLEHGEKVAVATANKLFLYDKKGVLRWQKNFDRPLAKYYELDIMGYEESYIKPFDEENIFVRTTNTLYLIGENGREIWSYKPGVAIINYSTSEDGNLLAVVFIDNELYFQLELLKIDDGKVMSLWRNKLSDTPVDLSALEEGDVNFIPNFVNESAKIVLDAATEFSFFDDKGVLLKKNVFPTNNAISSFDKKEKVLTVVSEGALHQYNASGKELLALKLPDNQSITYLDSIYYFAGKKLFYLGLTRKEPLTYLFNSTGKTIAKGNILVFSQMNTFDDYLVGVDDSAVNCSIAKYSVEGQLFWTKQKPRGKTLSLSTNEKENFIVIGLDNIKRFPDSPTFLIYGLKNGNLLWQEKLGNESARTERESNSNYLAVVADDKVLYFYDLKPILKEAASNEDR